MYNARRILTTLFVILLAALLAARAVSASTPDAIPRWAQPDGPAGIMPRQGRDSLPELEPITPANADRLTQVDMLNKGTITDLTYSPDGRILAVVTSVGIYLYDAGNLQQLRYIPDYNLTDVAFSPNGQLLASGSYKTVKIWHVADGQLLRTLRGHSNGVTSVAFSPGGQFLASGSKDHTVKVWRVADGQLLRTLQGHSDRVTCIAFSPNGRLLASGSAYFDGGTIKIWSVADGQLLRTLQGPSNVVSSVTFSPDGKLLASGSGASGDGTIKIWHVADGQILRTLQDVPGGVLVAFSPDSQFLASGTSSSACCSANTIKIWRVADGQLIRTFEGQMSEVSGMAFSPDGQFLASGFGGEIVEIWRVADGEILRSLQGHSKMVSSVAFSPEGQFLASGSGTGFYDGTIKLWHVRDSRLLRILPTRSDQRIGGMGVSGVAFSPGGQLLASGSNFIFDSAIKIWQVWDGQLLRTLKGHSYNVKSIAFSPNGQLLASGSSDETIKIWRVADGQLLRTLNGHSAGVTSVMFSPNGQLLASGSEDHTVRVWRVSNGQLLRTLTGHSDGVTSVAFSPDGKLLASGSKDYTVKVWHVANGQLLHTLRGHGWDVTSVAFSPDSQLLASGSKDYTVKVWHVANGQLLHTLTGHSDGVTSVAFSSDGKLLATSSWDGTVRLWGVKLDNPPAISNIRESHDPINRDGCPAPNASVIRADVTDDIEVASVVLHYSIGGQSERHIAMTQETGPTYKATLGPFSSSGTVQYYITARDNAGNERTSDPYTLTVRDCDTTPPTISDVKASNDEINRLNCPKAPKSTTISANVTDDKGIQSVMLHYQTANGQWHEQSMSRSWVGDTYSAKIESIKYKGIVKYYVEAIDTSGNPNESDYRTFQVQGCDVVFFLPGIMGSRLINEPTSNGLLKGEVWLPEIDWVKAVECQLFGGCPDIIEKITNSFIALALDQDGKEPYVPGNKITVGDIIKSTPRPFDDIYGDFLSNISKKYDVREFPYDWRKDNKIAAELLDNRINEVLAETGEEDVVLIGHSMGGLVIRDYVSDPTRAANVSKVITVGTPYWGTPEAIWRLMTGDIGIDLLDQLTEEYTPLRKDLLRNMPAIYQLLPSKKYHATAYTSPYLVENTPLDYKGFRERLLAHDKNSALFDLAENRHRIWDDIETIQHGPEYYILAARHLPTLAAVTEKSTNEGTDWIITNYDIGDGTVVEFSAIMGESRSTEHLKICAYGKTELGDDKTDHGKLMHDKNVIEDIESILRDGAPEHCKDINSLSALRHEDSAPIYQLYVWGDVLVRVYDEHGHFMGISDDGEFIYDIPGATYALVNRSHRIDLEGDKGYSIEIVIRSKVTIQLTEFQSENGSMVSSPQRRALFIDVPPMEEGVARLHLTPGVDLASVKLEFDRNDDGTPDEKVSPTSVLNKEANEDYTPPQLDIAIDGVRDESGFFTGPVTIIMNPQDVGSAGLKKTVYSLDGGRTWITYERPVHVIAEEVPMMLAYSVDRAGNYTKRTILLHPQLQFMSMVTIR